MAKTYTEVGRVSSESNPDREYIINQDEGGHLSCTCPAWRFKNSKLGDGDDPTRYCKHLKEHWQSLLR